MTEGSRQEINRRNARLSTGPRTAAGKRRVSQNARRHGLAIPAIQIPSMAPRINQLSRAIAGEDANPAVMAGARNIAEAQVEIERAREFLRSLMDNEAARRKPPSASAMRREYNAIVKMKDDELAIERMEALITSEEGVQLALEEGVDLLAKQLSKIQRYERRALSRRKRAMREFEKAVAAAR